MKKLRTLLLTASLAGAASLQASTNPNFWSVNTESVAAIIPHKAVARASYPREFRLFKLNTDLLRQQLFSVIDNSSRSTVIVLPNADGGFEEFEVFEASNFEPELQAQFPQIRAFSGKGVTDKYATLKLSISPQGIQTMIFRTDRVNRSDERR